MLLFSNGPGAAAKLRRLSPRLLFVPAALVFFSIVLLGRNTSFSSRRSFFSFFGGACPPTPDSQPPSPNAIPNQVHFVHIFNNGVTDFDFQFKHFLSIYATHHYWRPDAIYLHTNADEAAIERAQTEGTGKGGKTNKWNKLIFNSVPNLRVNRVEVPKTAGNGMAINVIEHKSDFVRTEVVRKMGGVYLDFDAHALRDVSPLRECGFAAIFGRQLHGQINNGVFFSRKYSLLLNRWWEEMNKVYNGGWTTHGNGVLTWLGPRLAGMAGGEVLILEQDALNPGSWEVEDNIKLFGLHNETASNLPATFKDGDPLPTYLDTNEERWTLVRDKKKHPAWERDYSSTWVLHAFDPVRNRDPVPGFKHITPRYVFERKSNFARAVYPVAKAMYDAGLVKADDLYKGED